MIQNILKSQRKLFIFKSVPKLQRLDIFLGADWSSYEKNPQKFVGPYILYREVVTPFYILSYDIKWVNYFLDTR